MKLLIDMDEVMCDFITPLCIRYNALTGDRLLPRHIDKWELSEFGITPEIWQVHGFFYSLQPLDGAVEVLWKYHKQHEIVVVTNHCGVDFIAEEKMEWVKKYTPFVSDIVFTDKKYEVEGDLLFDDCPAYLETFPNLTVKMIRRYNRDIKTDYKVKSWREFDQLLREV